MWKQARKGGDAELDYAMPFRSMIETDNMMALENAFIQPEAKRVQPLLSRRIVACGLDNLFSCVQVSWRREEPLSVHVRYGRVDETCIHAALLPL